MNSPFFELFVLPKSLRNRLPLTLPSPHFAIVELSSTSTAWGEGEEEARVFIAKASVGGVIPQALAGMS